MEPHGSRAAASEHYVLPPYADGPGARVVQATALFALGGAGFAAFGPAGAAAGAALAAFGYVALWSRVRVGCDGVRLPPWHGSRFVGYGELERVGVTDRSVTIETRDGETYYLPTQLGLGVGAGDHREVLSVDIEARAKAWRASGDVPSAEALEASSDDATETKLAYVARLRALGRSAGGSDYRASAIPADLLWSVVEHPRAGERVRAAAAIALAAAGLPSVRERLRAIAAESAAPHLRAVIEALLRRDAAAVSDDELARHLADH